MRISTILSLYVARQLLLWLAIMFLGIACLMFLLDVVEQLRKAAGKPDVTMGVVIQLSLLQLPFLYVLGVGPDLLWFAIPTQAPLLLMLGAFQSLGPWQWVYAVSVSMAGAAAAYFFSRARFRVHIGLVES